MGWGVDFKMGGGVETLYELCSAGVGVASGLNIASQTIQTGGVSGVSA